MSNRFFILFLIFIPFFQQCVPPGAETPTKVQVELDDPEIRHLFDLQDKGHTDSLFLYFSHKDPTFRYLAAMAFASIKDTLAIDSLISLLSDKVQEVSTAAAYSLGQIGHAKAEQHLIKSFARYDTAGTSKYFNATILEAIGKCGTASSLTALASISTYQLTDTALLEGQARGIYRFALRDFISPEGTSKMMEFATGSKYPSGVRLMGANYLSRARNITLVNGDSLIAPALAREDDPNIRMALAIALGKTKTERAANALLYQFNIERDYRVRCNLFRALGNFSYEIVKPIALKALKDPSTAVSALAAQYFVEHGVPEEASVYWEIAKEPGTWQVQLALYAAANKHMPFTFEESRKYLNWELQRRFESTADPYEKAAALKALAASPWNYKYIRDVGYAIDVPVVKVASVEALASIVSMPNFNQLFKGAKMVKSEIAGYFIEAIQNGDVGMTSVAAGVLREPNLGFKDMIDSLAFLESALIHFNKPQYIEAYYEVKKTYEYFKNIPETKPEPPKYSHPIDWKVVTGWKPSSRVLIKTDKGNITLALMPVYAPGTVANFLALTRDKFFNGKTFHRVVPNFVIQGGCPRGDGYGSLDYTIRSELPNLHYDKEGYVGMASAGNHTEGTQFFITHSPTPHLDGNYTIFARVVDGMDVVHKITIGDVINEVSVIDTKNNNEQ